MYCIALELFFAEIPQLTADNYNSVFYEFSEIVLLTIDKHAPLKHYLHRLKKLLKKPCITKGILVSIRKKKLCFNLTS